jgi:hypothetical protein
VRGITTQKHRNINPILKLCVPTHWGNNMSTINYDARIESTDNNEVIYIDKFDSDIWVNVIVKGMTCSTIINIDNAQKMVDALQRIIDSEKVAA